MANIDPRILSAVKHITKKRPKTIIDHIIKHGHVTTEELQNLYGYNHPPRGARDVREEGIPLETIRVRSTSGRSIGAYKFADPDAITNHKLGGRKVFSKGFKQTLIDRDSCKCSLCYEKYEDRYLTIDHRAPYEVSGDNTSDEHQPENFMLVCGTCQRKKSWSCEHCTNWNEDKNLDTCNHCFWANPESYTHLAGKEQRRTEIIWSDEEVSNYDQLLEKSKKMNISITDLIKSILIEK